MKTLKSRLIAAVGAALLIGSIPATSLASWKDPGKGDITYAIGNITAVITDLLEIGYVDVEDIKIVYLDDVLNKAELINIKNVLNNPVAKLKLLAMKNTLNNIDVLSGNEILTFGDVLSNNDIDIQDVVLVNVFDDGKLLVWVL